jgi:predicted TIM-barrel fold metal-dependent hydrolase
MVHGGNMKEFLKLKKDIYESIYKDIPVFDAHTHLMNGVKGMETLVCLKEMFDFKWMNILSISAMGDIAQNLKCMLFKALYPENNYIFGGLIHDEKILEEGYDYLHQVKSLISLGFQGMKMIEGKPGVRKELKKSLDDASYDGFYKFLEDGKIPVLVHIADPETFWDRETVPDWAYDNGWFYGDGSYKTKEELYNEVDRILNKFPKLHAIFAHFYFLSSDMERASEFLDKWQNVSIDLTPGTEMYVNFAKQPEKWREFFIKYQDRIIFGTDIYDLGSEEIENTIKTVKITRMFLETDQEFQVWDLNLKGIALDREALEKIYYRNFFKYIGDEPKKLDLKAGIEECKRTIEFALKSSAESRVIEEMIEIQDRLVACIAASQT